MQDAVASHVLLPLLPQPASVASIHIRSPHAPPHPYTPHPLPTDTRHVPAIPTPTPQSPSVCYDEDEERAPYEILSKCLDKALIEQQKQDASDERKAELLGL